MLKCLARDEETSEMWIIIHSAIMINSYKVTFSHSLCGRIEAFVLEWGRGLLVSLFFSKTRKSHLSFQGMH